MEYTPLQLIELSNRFKSTEINKALYNQILLEALPFRKIPKFDTIKNYKKAGVLVLIYPNNNTLNLVLIKRPNYDGHHANQISLPGGKLEMIDSDIIQTALRETHEEVGVKESDVKIIKKLNEIYIPPSNFMVYPVLGYCNHTPNFIAQKSEVEEIIELPLSQLLSNSELPTTNISLSGNTISNIPHFKFESHVIWGATCAILNEVRHLLIKAHKM